MAAALTVSSFVAVGPTPAHASGPNTGSILASVNASRADAGRQPLSLRSDLSAVAYRWSQKMAASGSLKHNPNLAGQVTHWRWVGENVGYGPDWRTVQAAFMNSPAHRANVLDSDYRQIGIGVVVRGSRVWITQVFRTPSGSATAQQPKKKKPAATKARSATAKPKPRVTARRTTRAVAPAPKPKAKPIATPAQLLKRRISTATQDLADRPSRDPLLAALEFAEAMRTVGG